MIAQGGDAVTGGARSNIRVDVAMTGTLGTELRPGVRTILDRDLRTGGQRRSLSAIENVGFAALTRGRP